MRKRIRLRMPTTRALRTPSRQAPAAAESIIRQPATAQPGAAAVLVDERDAGGGFQGSPELVYCLI